ncbi:MAG: diguanylate cyclase [Rhizobiaceae bacterium]|nr:diguanylate cyclase [Rhizobiaceae bacterium]
MRPVLSGSLGLGGGVFLLCLFGIFTRPGLDVATLWPANAFMLGMLVRFPSLATWQSWVAAAAGFILADAATGAGLVPNLVLNGCNLGAVAAGYLVFSRLDVRDRRLRRPNSVLFLLMGVGVMALVSGLGGSIADPMLFGGTPAGGLTFWFVTEAVNATAFLPLLLTLPRIDGVAFRRWRANLGLPTLSRALPLFALAVSAVAAMAIGGPGAIAVPVPALLWCALTFGIFSTACLAFAYGAWALLSIRFGVLPLVADLEDRSVLLSARAGVTLISLSPLFVASVMAGRNELVQRLRLLAERDQMTGLLNRQTFFDRSNEDLRLLARGSDPAAVMMVDIDHFKSINDRYGHAAGDQVIVAFASVLTRSVRPMDRVARIGGEEFAVFLPRCAADQAASFAAGIQRVLTGTNVTLQDGVVIRATVSIGIHAGSGHDDLHHLLRHADKALYRAKTGGRDRYEISVAARAATAA